MNCWCHWDWRGVYVLAFWQGDRKVAELRATEREFTEEFFEPLVREWQKGGMPWNKLCEAVARAQGGSAD